MTDVNQILIDVCHFIQMTDVNHILIDVCHFMLDTGFCEQVEHQRKTYARSASQ